MLGGNTSVIYEESARIYRLAENWREWVKRVAKAASKIGCKVFVLGSRVEGKASPSSDVDVLIVCRKLPKSAFERARIKARIEEEAGLPPVHPFEIHLISEDELKWYKRHAKRIVEVKGE